jgi:hypothetical protein
MGVLRGERGGDQAVGGGRGRRGRGEGRGTTTTAVRGGVAKGGQGMRSATASGARYRTA